MGWRGWLVVERSRDKDDVRNVKKNYGTNIEYLKRYFKSNIIIEIIGRRDFKHYMSSYYIKSPNLKKFGLFSLCESNPNPIEILMLSHPLFRMLVTILFFI